MINVAEQFKHSNPFLWRKIDILCHGIKTDKEGILDRIYVAQNPCDTARTGNAGLQVKLDNGNLALNVAVYKLFCEYSPYVLAYNSSHELVLHCSDDNSDTLIQCPETHPYWYEHPVNGHKIGDFILLEGDFTAIASITKGCTYFDRNQPCKFCAIGFEGYLQGDKVTADEHKKAVLAALTIVAQDAKITNIHLTGGNTESKDRGAESYFQFIKAIQSVAPNKQIAVEIPPPESSIQLGIFKHLKEAGVHSITINMEFWDDEERLKYMPIKGAIPKTDYINAYKNAQKVFGKNRVTCGFIVGLEPIGHTIEGIHEIIKLGVIAEVYPFKPNKGSQMENEPITSTDTIVKVSQIASELMHKNGIDPTACSGCVKCGACGLTQQLHENRYCSTMGGNTMYSEMIGKVALVTGGTSGLGYGIAKAFLEEGVEVIALYRNNDEKANKAKATLSKLGKFSIVKVDVADEKKMREVFSRLTALDYLVNCAGESHELSFIDLPMEDIKKVYNTQIFGKMIACKCAYPLLVKSAYPRIVNIASRFAARPFFEGMTALTSAEAAIIKFTECLALEWASFGEENAKKRIGVNCVSPSLTEKTGSYYEFYSDEQAVAVGKNNPSGRLGTHEDTANAVLFLCSKAADYITGENLNVNGGILLK
ncbi:hypothetical protein FACS1894211_06680 [Clostridia bacterium]|nr:hypothetical protein FACS1894211_06680 [Clostridia bacterium]